MTAGAPAAGGGWEEERLARAALCRLFEPGLATVRARLQKDGSAVPLWRQSCRQPELVLPVAGMDGVRARRVEVAPERDLADLARSGGRLVIPGDDEWPDLTGLPDEPFALWVRGPLHLRQAAVGSVAVVGARAATRYGERMAAALAAGLVERGRTIVSGGAYGIDAAAHRAALAAGGRSIAVLACGVDVAYPRGNRALLERHAEQGLVISEWPPGAAPIRTRFLVRNRVIAALSAGTVVVEAAVRSGARNTASTAWSLGRAVMAVPGPVTSPMSQGCHVILRSMEGARVVQSAADVLEEVGQIGVDLAPLLQAPQQRRDELRPDVRRVLEAVPHSTPVGPDRIGALAAVSTPTLLGALGQLLRKGYVERTPTGYLLSVAERAAVTADRATRRAAAAAGGDGGADRGSEGGQPDELMDELSDATEDVRDELFDDVTDELAADLDDDEAEDPKGDLGAAP